jgi:hypothetical protein
MRYEKPTSRDLSDLSFASGACASGTGVAASCNPTGATAGGCVDGAQAGVCSAPGSTFSGADCTTGQFAVNCAPTGQGASPAP